MIIKPSNPFSQSGTSRRAIAALLLCVALVLTCVSPAQARTGFSRNAGDGFERTAPEGFFHFLLRMLAFSCTQDAGGVMDPNGLK
jgi:hypothetical protein